MWIVYLVDLVIPGNLNAFGLVPRTLSGLIGIPTMPFLHGSLGHLLSNTIPLVVLLALLAGSRADSFLVVTAIVLYGGGLLWLLGRHSTHIGASSLVYGLVAFLILAGFFERRIIAILVSVLVGFVYGTTLISGVLPSLDSQVSWDGHLLGAVAGGLVAYFLARSPAHEQSSSVSVASQ